MTRMLENGQLEFIFEELDYDGAIYDLKLHVNVLLDYRDKLRFGSTAFKLADKKINDLIQIMLYCERLKVGQSYV